MERKVALTRASALVPAVWVRRPSAAKADDTSLKLQNEFYEKSHQPLDTRP